MFEIIKKWRELEFEARKKLIIEIGMDDKILNTIQQNFNPPNETAVKIREEFASAKETKKPNFFEAFFHLYPYSISLFVLGIIIGAFFIIITQDNKTGIFLVITIPIILNAIYIKITTYKFKQLPK